MKYYLSAFIFAFLSAQAIAAPVNIEGNYACKSIEVGSHQLYTGDATIKKTGDVYSVNSKFNDGSSYVGTGIYNPKKQVMAVTAVNTKDAKETGVSLNYIHANGDINAEWTYLGKTEASTVNCQKVKAA